MDSELRQQSTNSQGIWEGFLRCSLGSWGRGLVRMKLGTEGGGPGPGSWGRKPSGVSVWAGGRAERGLWSLSVGCGMCPDVSAEAVLSHWLWVVGNRAGTRRS